MGDQSRQETIPRSGAKSSVRSKGIVVSRCPGAQHVVKYSSTGRRGSQREDRQMADRWTERQRDGDEKVRYLEKQTKEMIRLKELLLNKEGPLPWARAYVSNSKTAGLHKCRTKSDARLPAACKTQRFSGKEYVSYTARALLKHKMPRMLPAFAG